MKRLFICFFLATAFVACNDSSGNKTEVKTDSTILAPETNSNMVDTRPLVIDSSGIDSSHLKPDTSTNR